MFFFWTNILDCVTQYDENCFYPRLFSFIYHWRRFALEEAIFLRKIACLFLLWICIYITKRNYIDITLLILLFQNINHQRHWVRTSTMLKKLVYFLNRVLSNKSEQYNFGTELRCWTAYNASLIVNVQYNELICTFPCCNAEVSSLLALIGIIQQQKLCFEDEGRQ